MSVRPIQADDVRSAAEAASRFTLRGVVTSERLGQAAAATLAQTPKPAPAVHASALKFSLGSKVVQAPQQASQAAAVRPAINAPAQMLNKKTDSHEVMRLTAYVDDLSTRLRETSARLKTQETALSRSNQALAAERHTAQQKLGSMKVDLDAAHTTEAKLRAELGAMTAKQQVKKENKEFLTSVRSAIATDAIEESKLSAAKDLEQRLDCMKDQQLQLEAHLAALTMDKSTAEKELSAANEVVEATQKKSIALSKKMAAQEERLVAMTHLAPTEKTNEDVATGDLLMMDMPTDCGDYEIEEEPSYNTNVCALAYNSWRPEVTGTTPTRLAAAKTTASVLAHANRPLPGAFIGQHFSHDAPIDLCHAVIGANGEAPQDTKGAADPGGMPALINAIVSDVRSLLQDSKGQAEEILARADQTPTPLYRAT